MATNAGADVERRSSTWHRHLTDRQKSLAAFAAVILAMAALIGVGWIGYLGSDDATYAVGAYGWLEQFPYVGGHGTIRYTITVPIALSFLVFGEHEFSLVLPTLLYTLGLVALIFFTTLRVFGRAAAAAAGLLVATMPLMALQASIASVDVIEALCIFASLVLLLRWVEKPSPGILFAAGATAALGYLTRETTAFLIVFYGVLFLIGFGGRRIPYLVMGAGFAAVWLVEILWLAIATGDPLYRLTIALNHDSSINRLVDVAGNIIVHPVLDPLLVILFNQEFALLFWVAIPAVVWLFRRGRLDPRQLRYVRVIAGFSVIWFLCVGAAVTLLPLNPRYFMPCAIGAAILLGIAVAQMFETARDTRPLAVAAALFLAANVASVYLDNRNYMFGEYKLGELARTLEAPVKTDPATERRAYLLLRWARAESKVSAAPPATGDLYLYNAPRLADLRHGEPTPLYRPAADWQRIAEYHPQPKLAGVLLKAIGAETVIPARVWNKLYAGHPGVVLYRVGGERP